MEEDSKLVAESISMLIFPSLEDIDKRIALTGYIEHHTKVVCENIILKTVKMISGSLHKSPTSNQLLADLTDFDLIQELIKRSSIISISCQVEEIECTDENGWHVTKAGEMKTFNLSFADKRSGLVEMKFNSDKVKDIEWIPSHLKFWNS